MRKLYNFKAFLINACTEYPRLDLFGHCNFGVENAQMILALARLPLGAAIDYMYLDLYKLPKKKQTHERAI